MKTIFLAATIATLATTAVPAQPNQATQPSARTEMPVRGGSSVTHGAEHGTTGMSSSAGRDHPNGSPNAAPKATTGPKGDPSEAENPPK